VADNNVIITNRAYKTRSRQRTQSSANTRHVSFPSADTVYTHTYTSGTLGFLLLDLLRSPTEFSPYSIVWRPRVVDNWTGIRHATYLIESPRTPGVYNTVIIIIIIITFYARAVRSKTIRNSLDLGQSWLRSSSSWAEIR